MKQISLVTSTLLVLSGLLVSSLSADSGVTVTRQSLNGAQVICVSNGFSSLKLDAGKFTLADIRDIHSKIGYVVEPGGSLFSVAFAKHPTNWYETPVTYTVDGSGAKKRWHKVVASGNSKALELHFDGCPVGVDGGSADVVVTIRSTPGDPVFKWGIRVQNHSDVPLGEVRFPTFQGLGSSLKGSDRTDYMVLPVYAGKRIDSPRRKSGGSQGWTEYPGAGMSTQLMCYCDGLSRGAMYLAPEDEGGFRKALISGPMASLKSFQWHVLHYADGASVKGDWKLPYEVACGPIQGDWYDAAKVYRRWLLAQGRLKPIYKRNNIPDWFKDLNVWFQGQDWNAPGSTDEQRMAGMRDLLVGIRDRLGEPIGFHWYLWNKGGFDLWPDYFPSKPGFKEAVKAVQDAGIPVMAYMDVQIFDLNAKKMWDDDKAEQWASRDINGNFNKCSDWNSTAATYKWLNMCISTKYWQDKVVGIAKTLADDYGVKSVYLDELHVYPYLCYAKNHPHEDIGGSFHETGYRTIVKRIRNETQNKDLALTCEHFSQTYADLLDGQLTWAATDPEAIPLFDSVMKDCTIGLGMQMVRSDFENMDSYVGKMGTMLVSGRQLGWINLDQSNLMGPELKPQMDFLRTSARCRREAKEFLLYGEFLRPPEISAAGTHSIKWSMHPSGTIEPVAVNIPKVLASAYKAPSGDIGLVLVNTTNTEQKLSIPVNFKDWGLKQGGSYERSEWRQASWSTSVAKKLEKTLLVTMSAYEPVVIRLHRQ